MAHTILVPIKLLAWVEVNLDDNKIVRGWMDVLPENVEIDDPALVASDEVDMLGRDNATEDEKQRAVEILDVHMDKTARVPLDEITTY